MAISSITSKKANNAGRKQTKSKIKHSAFLAIKNDFKKNNYIVYMAIPVVLWYIIFCYIPMFGNLIAFQRYSIAKGILNSEWVGFENFKMFFSQFYCGRVIKNTLMLNVYRLIFDFPAPIILALLLNEVKHSYFKRTLQTISYLPHFVSEVVICGMIVNFCSADGLINSIMKFFGSETSHNLLMLSQYYRTIYITSGIWQGIGWGSIIYLAALAGVSQEQYEAATIDGANRFQQMIHVTIPGIAPTIVMMFLLRIGGMMSEGASKSLLIYDPTTYEVSDLISTYVYRIGILGSDYSFSTAVGLFSSLINIILIISANFVSRKVSENSLW